MAARSSVKSIEPEALSSIASNLNLISASCAEVSLGCLRLMLTVPRMMKKRPRPIEPICSSTSLGRARCETNPWIILMISCGSQSWKTGMETKTFLVEWIASCAFKGAGRRGITSSTSREPADDHTNR